VVVTTSRDPSSRLSTFSKEIRLLFPTATRINRGKMIINDLVRASESAGQTDLITLHEKRGTPTALIASHFPHGPTAKFALYNVVLRGDIPGSLRGTVSEQYPHLIFEGFSTKLGKRICKILKNLFPPQDPSNVKPKSGGRVITFQVCSGPEKRRGTDVAHI
jgi:U3 small nucleolar ribonucleoprotein protein IMP4